MQELYTTFSILCAVLPIPESSLDEHHSSPSSLQGLQQTQLDVGGYTPAPSSLEQLQLQEVRALTNHSHNHIIEHLLSVCQSFPPSLHLHTQESSESNSVSFRKAYKVDKFFKISFNLTIVSVLLGAVFVTVFTVLASIFSYKVLLVKVLRHTQHGLHNYDG